MEAGVGAVGAVGVGTDVTSAVHAVAARSL